MEDGLCIFGLGEEENIAPVGRIVLYCSFVGSGLEYFMLLEEEPRLFCEKMRNGKF